VAGIHQDATMEEVEAAAKAANASDFITALPQAAHGLMVIIIMWL